MRFLGMKMFSFVEISQGKRELPVEAPDAAILLLKGRQHHGGWPVARHGGILRDAWELFVCCLVCWALCWAKDIRINQTQSHRAGTAYSSAARGHRRTQGCPAV